MTVSAYETARSALMLYELRPPTIRRLWSEFSERSDRDLIDIGPSSF